MQRFALLTTLLALAFAPRAARAQDVPVSPPGGPGSSALVTPADTLASGNVAASDASLGPDAERELDAAFAIVRRASLWRDTVTWSRVEPDVRAIAEGSQSAADTYPALRALLARLGDHHSFFMRPQSAAAFGSEGAANPRASVRVQAAGIGYVAVPAYNGGNGAAVDSYVRAAYDSLAHAVASGAGTCRWIVDLRGNTGGNMWPMLGAVRPFVGEDDLGAFVTGGIGGRPWRAGDRVRVTPPPSLHRLDSANVAVLVDSRTASSGEATAIAFIGRARTRTFGVPTAGLSTGNLPMSLPDGAMLVVTTAVDADRTGKVYSDGITPDEVILGVPIDAPGYSHDDPQMERAQAWLESRSCAQLPTRRRSHHRAPAATKTARRTLSDSAGTRGRRR